MDFEKDLKQLIAEEYGISNTVSETSEEIIKAITSFAKQGVLSGEIKVPFGKWKNKLAVQFFVFSCTTEDEMKEFLQDPGLRTKYLYDKDVLVVKLPFDKELERVPANYTDVVRHEVHHAFQTRMAGSDWLENREKEYTEAIRTVDEATTTLEQDIAFVVYYSFNFERDAITNDIYHTVLNSSQKDERQNLLMNTHYRNMQRLGRLISSVDSGDTNITNNIKNALNGMYGGNFTFNSFLKLAKHVYKEYLRNFGRAIVKGRKDRQKN